MICFEFENFEVNHYIYLPYFDIPTYTLILHASVYVGWNGIQYTTLKAAFAAAWTCHTFDFTYWRFKMQVLKIPNFHKLLKTQARFFLEMDGRSAAGHEKIVRQKFKTICILPKKFFYGKMSPDMMGCLEKSMVFLEKKFKNFFFKKKVLK